MKCSYNITYLFHRTFDGLIENFFQSGKQTLNPEIKTKDKNIKR